MTPEQLRNLLTEAYIAGYTDGRASRMQKPQP